MLGSALADLDDVAARRAPPPDSLDARTAPVRGGLHSARPHGCPGPLTPRTPRPPKLLWWQDGEVEGQRLPNRKSHEQFPRSTTPVVHPQPILRCAQALLPLREPATPTRVRETSGLTGGNCSSPQRRCGPEPLRVFRGNSCIGATPSSGSSTQFPFGNQGSPLVPEAQGVAYPPLLRKEVCLFDFAASSRAACFGFIFKRLEATLCPDFKTLRL